MSNIKLVHSGGNSVSLTTPTSNPSSNVTFKLPAADGTAGQVLQTDGNGNLTFVDPGGITMADQWRLTANAVGGSADITSNWERNDSTGFGQLGTGMTESSGIFTFPSTGIYLVTFYLNDLGGSSFLNSYSRLYVTTDNSSYTEVARGHGVGAANHSQVIPAESIIDVTDTSNVKVKFSYYHGDGGGTALGNTSINVTYVTFIRLGDT